jgi:hypothetical protein
MYSYVSQVAKFNPSTYSDTPQPNNSISGDMETEQVDSKEPQRDEDATKSSGSWDTLDDPDVVHVVGDIIHVRLYNFASSVLCIDKSVS